MIIFVVLIALMLSAAAVSAAVKSSSKTGWKTSGGNKYYYYEKGKYYKDRIVTIKGSKYYFDKSGHMVTGRFSYKSSYYYAASSGKIKTTAGFIKSDGNRYYVKDGGKFYCRHTLYLGDKRYKTFNDGRIGTGLFKYGPSGYYYFADSNGVVHAETGFVKYNDSLYFTRSFGATRRGESFVYKGDTYMALSDSRIATGVFKWTNGSYYYADPTTGKVKTSKGWITYKGKKYYAASGGKLYKSQFFTVSGKKYYASSTCAIKTGTFTVGGKQYKTTSSGKIIELSGGKVKGIDVSYFQHTINWPKVKLSGIRFAIIRAGFRGSNTGKLTTDSTFYANIKNANASGIDVGVYFFTQAVTTSEARKEADYTIRLVKKSGVKPEYPIVIDTENISGGRAAIGKLSRSKRTAVIKAFCDEVKANGYTPMIYASTSWLNNQLDMSKLSGYEVWVAQYYSKVTYGGTYKCWQYSSTGSVNGISGNVDMDYWYN